MEHNNRRLPGGKPPATFTCDEILRCIQNKPERLDDKKWHELVVGYLLCQFFSDNEKSQMCVRFPLVQDWESLCSSEQLTICKIIENHAELIEDRDIDIHVGFKRQWQKCQITCFKNHPRSKSKASLAQLIMKKCSHYQPDPSCMLVISVERQPHITEEQLRRIAENPKIPFGSVILIRKASTDRGHFSFCQIHPNLVLGKEIRIPLLV